MKAFSSKEDAFLFIIATNFYKIMGFDGVEIKCFLAN